MTTQIRNPAAYIMANKRRGTLYTGAASDLPRRAWQHREGVVEGFTKRYGCKLLVWYENGPAMESVFLREKQIKGDSAQRRLR